MAVIAVVAIVQMLLQLAGWSYQDVLLTRLPEDLFLEGFNTSYPVQYGSDVIKSNAFVFLEPSFLSQFIALAFVIELVLDTRLWRLALYLGALLTTVSGTGVVLLAFGIAFALFKSTDKKAVRVLVPLVLAVGVALATPVGTLFSERFTQERDIPTSSLNARFIEPYERAFGELDESVQYVAVGRGPGAAQRDGEDLFVRKDIAVAFPVVPKLVFEYGLVAAAVFSVFIVYSFLNRARSVVIAGTALLMQFLLSGALLQPHTVLLCYVLTSLFALTGATSAPLVRSRRGRFLIATQ
jgi:hypothetical protein